MENNIFLLNEQNELFLCYDKIKHIWNIPIFKLPIEDIKSFYEKEHKITTNAEKEINNNYICRTNSSVPIYKDEKWFKYYDIVQMQFYEKHKKIIDEIYKDLKLTIILDIDLTLLEANNNMERFISKQPNYIINTPSGEYTILFRPHLKYFLDSISKFTNIIYWTAATKEHQEPVLQITGLDRYCQKVYYRDTCICIGGKYIKDITKIDLDTKRTLLIDDNMIHKEKNPFNCLLIKSWGPNTFRNMFDDDAKYLQDIELVKMIGTLQFFSEHIIHDNYTTEKCFRLLDTD